jgi:hypothetical protein
VKESQKKTIFIDICDECGMVFLCFLINFIKIPHAAWMNLDRRVICSKEKEGEIVLIVNIRVRGIGPSIPDGVRCRGQELSYCHTAEFLEIVSFSHKMILNQIKIVYLRRFVGFVCAVVAL